MKIKSFFLFLLALLSIVSVIFWSSREIKNYLFTDRGSAEVFFEKNKIKIGIEMSEFDDCESFIEIIGNVPLYIGDRIYYPMCSADGRGGFQIEYYPAE